MRKGASQVVRRERAARIREVVESLGGQREVARLLFKSAGKSTVVNEWCSGKKKGPNLDNYVLFATKTGTKLDSLLGLPPKESVTQGASGPWGVILNEILDELEADEEVQREWGTVDPSAWVAASARGTYAVAVALRRPTILRMAKAKYLEAFRFAVNAAAQEELEAFRREKVAVVRRSRARKHG